ncbi:hypothetical protein LZ496_11360 [Sphingomonas sp. NSE70-1]|uniref:Uncharacterized protein n=1 Tax=Sphingomonas caseinilyticus TaxID=2908205 RepID=A0ABT0RXD3_9SPHN|nr:hypothetical protein [Sphingomonas caseinilyticus]MCL6699375.1 hypothetical protein [Sphingomonas caseinilyticus]
MQQALPSSRPPFAIDWRNANFLLTAIFWAFTYALFTYRAQLRYGDAYELVDTIRFVSTAVGAGLYWLVLSYLIDGTRDRPGKPLAILATILPATIVVLLARVLLEQMGATNPNGFPGDLRFVMVWGGYFGLWVSASFALRVMPRLNFGAEMGLQRFKAKRVTVASQNKNALFRAEVLERLALEIASLPAAERRALVEEFTVPLSYETADELELHVSR